MKTNEWEETLRRDAARLKNETPEGLDQKISQAVANSSRPKAPVLPFNPALLVLAAAACAAVAIYLHQRPLEVSDSAPQDVALVDSATAAPGEDAALSEAADLLQQDPLQDEANSVYSDARSALSFLENNFLPSTPEKSG